jgi:hypothetical protein
VFFDERRRVWDMLATSSRQIGKLMKLPSAKYQNSKVFFSIKIIKQSFSNFQANLCGCLSLCLMEEDSISILTVLSIQNG